jgi:carotenoid cleavage dioxygenase-like enzyme
MASAAEQFIRATITRGVMALASFNRARMSRNRPAPFLDAIHRPMTAERTIPAPEVVGAIPAGLDGRYLRIGPNPIAPDPRGHHWFVGDGMVHGLRLAGGRAEWYRNRWIRSEAVAEALHEAPAPGPRHGPFDTVNTALLAHAGVVRALVEAGSTPVRLDGELGSQAYDDFGGTLRGAFAAHPHLDPRTGELHAIAYQGTQPDHVTHVVVDAAGRVRRELRIPMKHGPMIHDCAITQRYVVILDLPVTFSLRALVGGYTLPYRWNPKQPARVGLLPREGGVDDIVWIPVDPAFVFHTVNAYDTADGLVVLDLVAFDKMFQPGASGPDASPRGLERWTLDPANRSMRRQVLHDEPQEFPRIDERRCGQPHRYAYTLGLPRRQAPEFVEAGHLWKHDLETGRHQRHDFGPGRVAGEFAFVPRHAGAAEDEGWLMGLVIDTASDTTELAIIDAQDFEAAPVARVRIPHRVPPGFHGAWIPD